MTAKARLWVRSGLVWLLLGMAAGIQIGIAGEFGASSHHAHMGLLGGLWAIAFGLLYDRSGAPLTAWAKVKWGLYNLGVAAMALGMYMVVRSGEPWGLVIAVGGVTVFATTICIVIGLWPRAPAEG
jgi:hypothetical protein